MTKRKYKVTGMSCAACSLRVERAVSGIADVDRCEVNLILGEMNVFGEASPEAVKEAVELAGYGIEYAAHPSVSEPRTAEKRSIARRLIVSASILAVLMYISMAHMMLGAPLPRFLASPLLLALVQMCLSASILVINKHFFINGVRGIVKSAPNMDTLVSLGAAASFVYSLVLTVIMAVTWGFAHTPESHAYLMGLYFESAAMLPVLITVGKLLEASAKGKTADAISSLMRLAPKRATVERDGVQTVIDCSQIAVGDVLIVRRGESIPTDAEVIEGNISVDESALTGEAMPRYKISSEQVFAGTTVISGYAKIRACKTAEETVLSQIINTVKEASSSKAPIAKTADKVAGVFVPAVLCISLITAAVWLLLKADFSVALTHAVSVLVISCPCALGLATPVAIMVASGVGAKHGILFKDAAAIELSGRARVVAFDKTGTLTEGRPFVTDVAFASGEDSSEYMSLLAAAESMSEHPLARATVTYAEENGLAYGETAVSEFIAENGGISVLSGGRRLYFGNRAYALSHTEGELGDVLNAKFEQLSAEGKTVLLLADSERVRGVVAYFDRPKSDSARSVALLHKMGIETVMITGDSKAAADHVASLVGIDRTVAEVLPCDKARVIKELSATGTVVMVGDGVNDSVALTEADVGIAVGCGTDIAIDSADVVLREGEIAGTVEAIRLGRRTLRGIYENLFFAFCYNMIGIPLAAGVFSGWLGWTLSPMFGAAAMSVSSFLVVTNALRINSFKPIDKKTLVNENIINEKVDCEMNVTIKIEGMMCPHCSGRVAKLLLECPAVKEADVSHERGDAVLNVDASADISALEKIIEDAGYKVVK